DRPGGQVEPAVRRGPRQQAPGVRLPGRPPHGDEVPQDAEHPVVAAAEGLVADQSVVRGPWSVATIVYTTDNDYGPPAYDRPLPARRPHPPGRRPEGDRAAARQGPPHRPRAHRPPD